MPTLEHYQERVKAPHPASVNSGLTSPRQAFMVATFGMPRAELTHECKGIDNPDLKKRMYTSNVGPFKVTGHVWATVSLKRIFARAKVSHPDLMEHLGTAGMLCVRLQRGSRTAISNHSWGTAIDLTIGGKLDRVGDGLCQRGLLALYRFFHEEGWYWGVEYGGAREDSMHFELAEETIRRLAHLERTEGEDPSHEL